MKKLLAVACASLWLMGCSMGTLNKVQCQNADWYTFGLADGSNGGGLSNMQGYQMACSKYGVRIDPDMYTKGHEKGIRSYCTPSRGFESGKSGVQYQGVCPPDLEGPFLEAFARGSELHAKITDLNNISAQIENHERQIDALEAKKRKLISDKNPEMDRATLVRESDAIHDKVDDLENKIRRLKKIRREKEEQYGIHEGSYADY